MQIAANGDSRRIRGWTRLALGLFTWVEYQAQIFFTSLYITYACFKHWGNIIWLLLRFSSQGYCTYMILPMWWCKHNSFESDSTAISVLLSANMTIDGGYHWHKVPQMHLSLHLLMLLAFQQGTWLLKYKKRAILIRHSILWFYNCHKGLDKIWHMGHQNWVSYKRIFHSLRYLIVQSNILISLFFHCYSTVK